MRRNFKETFLQTDPRNLIHLTDELEKALNESKNTHTRKVQKYL